MGHQPSGAKVPILPPPPTPPAPFVWPNRMAALDPSKMWRSEPPELPTPRARANPTNLVISSQMPMNPKPGDAWMDSMTGEMMIFRAPGCQHPNPEPVVLTTDEVVAAVCPDCLQPLPPASVGSEWKP